MKYKDWLKQQSEEFKTEVNNEYAIPDRYIDYNDNSCNTDIESLKSLDKSYIEIENDD